jgi:hypothetical protein
MYFIYVRFQETIYLITPKEKGVGMTEEEAEEVVNFLVERKFFGGHVTHESSGDRFYLGIPAASMKDVVFFSKEKKAE